MTYSAGFEVMNFGDAIEAMKKGKKVARRGWNGNGMFVYLVNGSTVNGELLRDAPPFRGRFPSRRRHSRHDF